MMAGARYLLIDAYNVICATDHLRDQLAGNLDGVRDQLAEQARAILDAEGVRVAMILDSPNDQLQVEHPFGSDRFEYLYAPAALAADGVIERIIQRASSPGDVTVVSNDNMIREATRARGRSRFVQRNCLSGSMPANVDSAPMHAVVARPMQRIFAMAWTLSWICS